MSSFEKKNIFVICPTPIEFRSLCAGEPLKFGKREYFKIENQYFSLFVIRGGLGKVWASASTEAAIQCFGAPHFIIDYGTCGALHSELNVGDIFVSEKVIEHDYHTDTGKRSEISCFSISLPKSGVVTGVLLSGDEDVETPERRKELSQKFGGDVVCWEASAVGKIAKFHKVPFLSFRVISDTGNGDLLAEFKKNAPPALSKAAQFFLREFLNYLM